MSSDGSGSNTTDNDVVVAWWPRQQYAYVLATLLATALLTTTLSVWQVGVTLSRCAAACRLSLVLQLHRYHKMP